MGCLKLSYYEGQEVLEKSPLKVVSGLEEKSGSPDFRVDYYPFGMAHAGGYQRVTAKRNPYKFNGVEHVEDIGFDMYTTLFRLYDPKIGRFHQVDPLADFFPGINPFSFGLNNPISYGDPYGLAPMWWIKLKAQINKFGKRLKGDKTSAGVATGRHKGKLVTVTTKNHKLKRHHGQPSPTPEPVAKIDPPNTVKPKGLDSEPDKPGMPDIAKVDIPQSSRPPALIDNEPVTPGREIRTNGSPFGANRSTFRNSSNTKGFLSPIAEALKTDPNLAITIMVQTNLSKNEMDKIINFDGQSKNGTLNDLLSKRGQAIQKTLLNLGVDPRQMVYMHVPGASNNSVRIRFRQR